jgi:hypothetical protein
MRMTSQYDSFNSAMGKILRADPKAVKEAMEREKQQNAEKRKTRNSSASDHVSDDKD